MRSSKTRSDNCIINQSVTFYKANDISDSTFNPVISKIENFMAKKEKRNTS